MKTVIDASTIARCWAYSPSPCLNRLKTEGRLDAARDQIIAASLAGLKTAYPSGDYPPHAYCHALELAAEQYLQHNPAPATR